jgi:DNA-binding LacI/PurR family transcriptional regulator
VRPPTEGKDWSDIRFKDLSYLGSSKGITVHLIEDDELTVYTGWCDIGKSVREELDRAKNLASDANSGSISRKEGISPGTRILLEEIRKHNLTCLVAANDCAAEYISIKLALAGVRIPQDISLLSFDNRSESCFFPISTIDPCFDSLGYFAAHLLLKDFPVPKDRYHTVRNKPRLVNRGSLVPINIINSAI